MDDDLQWVWSRDRGWFQIPAPSPEEPAAETPVFTAQSEEGSSTSKKGSCFFFRGGFLLPGAAPGPGWGLLLPTTATAIRTALEQGRLPPFHRLLSGQRQRPLH